MAPTTEIDRFRQVWDQEARLTIRLSNRSRRPVRLPARSQGPLLGEMAWL